jgi:hypothetical protein
MASPISIYGFAVWSCLPKARTADQMFVEKAPQDPDGNQVGMFFWSSNVSSEPPAAVDDG